MEKTDLESLLVTLILDRRLKGSIDQRKDVLQLASECV